MKLLLKKYIEGICNPSEKEQLEEALKRKMMPNELQDALKDLWKAPSLTQLHDATIEENQVLNRIHDTMDAMENNVKSRTGRFRINTWKYAASAIAFIMISIGAWYSGYSGLFQKEQFCMVSAPKKHSSQILLPDGTNVWLNSGSSLSYSTKYGKITRSVKLVGEGFFDVQKDKRHPFIVTANDVEVTALGTKFNVESYHSKEIIVTLKEGCVKTVRGAEEKILNPGMQAIVTNENIALKEVDTNLYTSWHLGKITFKDVSLLNMAHQLEKIYDVKIIFKSDSLKAHRYRGVINTKNSILKTLDKIQLSTNIRYKIDKNQVIFMQK